MASKQPHPDADLHPEATGTAAPTVQDHEAELPLKLYSGWFCPFVQRAWMVLEEKRIPYQYIEVNPYHKPESLMTLNPRGLVPTLQYHEKPLYESTVICDFLDEVYKGMKIWSDFITSRFIPGFHRFLQQQPSSGGGSDADLQKARDDFLGLVREFTLEMDDHGPYFTGAEPMMIGFLIAPWALRLWVFDEFKGGLGLPANGHGGEDEHVWTRWRSFVAAISSRASVRATTSEQAHYVPIYRRYAEDKAQSELARAIRAGRGVP